MLIPSTHETDVKTSGALAAMNTNLCSLHLIYRDRS